MLRHPRVHDEKHLDFVRSLPCLSCWDDTATEAAHLRTGAMQYAKRETGLGEKPSDRWTLPLCSKCHRLQHEGNELGFWTTRGINPFVLCLVLHSISGDHETAIDVMRRSSRAFA